MQGGRFTVSPFYFWEWWPLSDRRIRFGIAVVLLLVGGLMAVAIRLDMIGPVRDRTVAAGQADEPPPRSYRAPMVIAGLGFVFLIFAGRSRAEALRYND
jgi:hypothetical protein